MVEFLAKEGANVVIDDINQERLAEVSSKYGATIYKGNNLYQEEMDIYSPCALGATINNDTVHQLKAKVIAGAANNQLADENVHGQILANRGILYAPDFLINAGGIINIYREISGYSIQESQLKLENIYNTTLEICGYAEQNKMTTQAAAMQMAQKTIEKRKQEKA